MAGHKSNIVNINEFVKRNPKLSGLVTSEKPSPPSSTVAVKKSYLDRNKEYIDNLSKKRNRSIQCAKYEEYNLNIFCYI